MHNFGRGMWRRVGDYDRVQAPQVQKNFELQYYLALLEQNKRQRLEQTFYTDKRQMKQQTNNNKLEMVSDKKEHIIECKEEVPTVVEEEVLEAEVLVEQIATVEEEVLVKTEVLEEVATVEAEVATVEAEVATVVEEVATVVEEVATVVEEVATVVEEPSIIVPKKSKKKNKK